MSFSLTRKTDYALVALSKLAREKAVEGGPLSARQLAEEFHLPPHLLMNALKDLHRADILCSQRGANGGYYLCREPAEVSLLEIIEALEGSVRVTLCSDEPEENGRETCQFLELCPISDPVRNFNHLLNEFLSNISLANLSSQESGLEMEMVV